MSVVEEFKREMEAVRARSKSPREELMALYLMALEREELVTVGYRESVMRERLSRMPLTDEIKALVLRSMIWVWKDEEMHAILVRGVLLEDASALGTARALSQQAAGRVGGWTASMIHHVPLRRAPISGLLARVLQFAGALVGKVPEDVRKHLKYGAFRDFCAFNIDAELTARICWEHMADLVTQIPDAPSHLSAVFTRIARDEENHREIFSLWHRALDDQDRLRPEYDAETLIEHIAQIDEAFLPRRHRRARGGARDASPVTVHVEEDVGRQAGLDAALDALLERSELAEIVAAQAAGRPPEEVCAAIKVSFNMGYHEADRAVMTNPRTLKRFARHLRRLGVGRVLVLDTQNIYQEMFQNRQVAHLARVFGFESDAYEVIDASAELEPHDFARGVGARGTPRSWRQADVRVSFSKMRSHPIDLGMLCLGNLEWMAGHYHDFLFLERQAERETLALQLHDAFPVHFALLDAYEDSPDGISGLMACPSPRHPGRFYASRDPLALDLVAMRHMGVRNPHLSPLLKEASDWAGGDPILKIDGPDTEIAGWRGPLDTDLRALMSLSAHTAYVLGSGRGDYFVPEMDPRLFPPVGAVGWHRRLIRALTQRLLGVRRPALPAPSDTG